MSVRDVDLDALIAAYRTRDARALEERGHALGVTLTLETMGALEEVARWQLSLADVLTAVSRAAGSDAGIGLVEIADDTMSGYPGRDFALAVRTDAAVVVGSAHAKSKPTKIAGVWPELSPWFRDLAKNRARATAWAEADDPERVLLPLSHSVAPTPAIDEQREAELMRAIVDDPDDDTRRLVFADWLLERGDARGALIQLQCELAASGQRHPSYRELVSREEALLEQHGPSLAGDVARYARDYRLRRGFVDEVAMAVPAFLKHGARLFEAQPIRTLRLKPTDDEGLDRIGRSPALGKVRGLSLVVHRRLPLRFGGLVWSDNLGELRDLDVSGCVATPDDWSTLFGSIRAPKLASLHAHGAVMSANGLLGFVRNATVRALSRLDIAGVMTVLQGWSNRDIPQREDEVSLREQAFHALGHAKAFRELHQVNVSNAWGGVSAMLLSSWLRGPNAASLDVLVLSRSGLGEGLDRPDEIYAGLRRLRRLDVSASGIGVESVGKLLAAIPTLEELTWSDGAGAMTSDRFASLATGLPSSHCLRRLVMDRRPPPSDALTALEARFEIVTFRPGAWWIETHAFHPALTSTQ